MAALFYWAEHLSNRVGQTTGLSTTHFALDVLGLPEVIYTSPSTPSAGQAGTAYLHLSGVMMAKNEAGEVRYLL